MAQYAKSAIAIYIATLLLTEERRHAHKRFLCFSLHSTQHFLHLLTLCSPHLHFFLNKQNRVHLRTLRWHPRQLTHSIAVTHISFTTANTSAITYSNSTTFVNSIMYVNSCTASCTDT